MNSILKRVKKRIINQMVEEVIEELPSFIKNSRFEKTLYGVHRIGGSSKPMSPDANREEWDAVAREIALEDLLNLKAFRIRNLKEGRE